MSPLPLHEKVVGVGLGRTGTNSLCAALNHLGIRTKHVPGLLAQEDLRTGKKHLEVLQECQGIANGSGVPYRLVDRMYPGSRFILTVRHDTDRWLESKRRYAELELQNWTRYGTRRAASKRLMREEIYGSFEFDADRWLESYQRHNREVRDYFEDRSGSLLEMDITSGDGWDVLCPFLDVASPGEPFPHRNSLEAAVRWHGMVADIWKDVGQVIGSEHDFVLVDDGALGDDVGRALPFLERDGRYWGRPADDESAVAELERMRGMGAAFLVFVSSTFWWLEHYQGFSRHLWELYSDIFDNDRVLIFDLRERRTRPPKPTEHG